MDSRLNRQASFDAIVVGSGANGGIAAMELASRGLSVLVLEAGPSRTSKLYGTPLLNRARQLKQHWFKKQQYVQEWHAAYWETNPDLFVNDAEHPYSTPSDKPFLWIRSRQTGGKSHLWGGVTLRFSDLEFKAATRDGIGTDWPVSTKDLAPFYTKLERFFDVHGNQDGLAQLPDGHYSRCSRFSPAEEILRETVAKQFNRTLIMSRGINATRRPEPGNQFSRLSSPQTSLAVALNTRRVVLKDEAVVTRLVKNAGTMNVKGVEYIDCRNHSLNLAEASVVFLCASTIESLRILLMSETANESGLIGKGVLDSMAANTFFYLPSEPERDLPLTGADSILIPRYQNVISNNETFCRGFGFWGGIQRLPFSRQTRTKPDIALGFLCGMAESLPSDKNQVRLDPALRDAWGLPAPHISCSWSDNDLAVASRMQADAGEIISAAGGVVTSLPEALRTPLMSEFMRMLQKKWELTVPGLFVHEVGGARMGTSATTSVLNPHNQLWEHPNVFVTDGACCTSSAWQNPTLTEMALAARAAEYAVSELAKKNL